MPVDLLYNYGAVVMAFICYLACRSRASRTLDAISGRLPFAWCLGEGDRDTFFTWYEPPAPAPAPAACLIWLADVAGFIHWNGCAFPVPVTRACACAFMPPPRSICLNAVV